MRRVLKIAAWMVGVVVLLLVSLVAGLWVAGNSDSGLRFIENTTARLTSGYVRLSGLGGSLPASLTLQRLELVDAHGVWLSADDVVLRWSPIELLWRRIHIDDLKAARVQVERAPYSESNSGGSASFPHIEVAHLAVGRVELGAPLVGNKTTLVVSGSLLLRSLQDANADVVARRLDGDGDYTAHLRLDRKRMDGSLRVREPAGGPLENLLQLPGLGALSAAVTLEGPRNAERLDLAIDAGELQARAKGTVNLSNSAADVDFTLQSPTLRPRSDLAWRRLDVSGEWHGPWNSANATGSIHVAGLEAPANVRLAALDAAFTAKSGLLSTHAVATGLQIPGKAPQLFAGSPLTLDTTLDLKDAARPLDVTAQHRLLALHARATTAGEQRATLDLKLLDLVPFASLASQDIRGSAAIKATLARDGDTLMLTLDSDTAVSGGNAAYLPLLGPKIGLQVAGAWSPDILKIDHMKLAGRVLNATVSGTATRAPKVTLQSKRGKPAGLAAFFTAIQAKWELELADLSVLSSSVAGNLKASGQLAGPAASLTANASAVSLLSVHGSPSGRVEMTAQARGLPGAPSGTLQLHGLVDDAPVKVDVAVERNGAGNVQALVRQAEWKSLHVVGAVTVDADLMLPRGQLTAHVGELNDLSRLLRTPLAGQLDGNAQFMPLGGKAHVELSVDGRQLSFGNLTGSAKLHANGTADALALQFDAELPSLWGTPATLAATASLATGARQLQLSVLSADYRGQSIRLVAPSVISFANGVAIDQLQLAAQAAVFEFKGALSPALDARVYLRQLKPSLVNVFVPGLLAEGDVDAGARLQGTIGAPTGRVRLDATGVKFGDDAASGLPAFDAHARAQLTGDAANLDVRLSAAANSLLTITGGVPLDPAGILSLKVTGKLDIALVNPLLEARGLHSAGELNINASVDGTAAAPKIGGTVSLAGGNFRDYGRGISLSDITAEAIGSEGSLQLKSFDAKAASGSVSLSGTVGVMQPGIPVDLKVIAKNAQPVSSSIVTANLDADISVRGTARERLDVGGTIHVNRATIGIPNSLPPDVAVLDVRRRGAATSPVEAEKKALIIGVDIVVSAPQEILVQGRGLDAELGGDIHLTGTMDALLASGGFDLQRGSFTLAGSRLNFKQGRVGFDGAGLRKKIDPTLDFTAETTLAEGTATLHITGVADAPRFEFSSAPTNLPQDQIMAQLLFGQNAASLSALQAAQIGAALATLSGVGGGSNPLTKLQRSLGLDRLSVGTNNTSTTTNKTDNSGASIEAGRYVSKRVYIEGKQTTTGASQVQVDVDLTKHLKLQTRLGTGNSTITQGTTPENDPGSSVGLSYQFEY